MLITIIHWHQTHDCQGNEHAKRMLITIILWHQTHYKTLNKSSRTWTLTSWLHGLWVYSSLCWSLYQGQCHYSVHKGHPLPQGCWRSSAEHLSCFTVRTWIEIRARYDV